MGLFGKKPVGRTHESLPAVQSGDHIHPAAQNALGWSAEGSQTLMASTDRNAIANHVVHPSTTDAASSVSQIGQRTNVFARADQIISQGGNAGQYGGGIQTGGRRNIFQMAEEGSTHPGDTPHWGGEDRPPIEISSRGDFVDRGTMDSRMQGVNWGARGIHKTVVEGVRIASTTRDRRVQSAMHQRDMAAAIGHAARVLNDPNVDENDPIVQHYRNRDWT